MTNQLAHKRSFNPCIHGLRGFAAMTVFLFHIYDMMRKQGVVSDATVYLPLKMALISLSSGVDLFFMISGYLITASLIQHANVRRFLIDRVIRIYPVFLFLHVCLFILGPIIHYKWMENITWNDWLMDFFTNMFFVPDLFDIPLLQLNAWTLSYEFAFYLFAAATYVLFMRQRRWVWLLVGLAPILIFFHPRSAFFAIGITIYFLLNKRPDWLSSKRWHLGWLSVMPFYVIIGYVYTMGEMRLCWLALLPGFFLFLDIVKGAPPFARFLQHRVMQFLGTISYSFYLWHPVVTYPLKIATAKILIERFGMGTGWAIALFSIVSFILVLPVSYASYCWLEQKAGRWLKSLASSDKRTNVA